ncbi:KRAB-A domain-containing protein 2 [Trichonephila clavipes]|nr:KRAB-A domain-containing protein 2 [Trichonephila clavipes]
MPAMVGYLNHWATAAPEEQLEEIANTFESEEQLEKTANTFETEEQLEETGNTSEKHLSGGHTENHIPKKNIEEDLQSTTSSHQVLTEKHELISKKRAAARKRIFYCKQQKCYELHTQKKFAPAQIGDTVRIQVPDVDRGRTENRNVLAVVVGIEDSNFYKLANENGTQKQLYTSNQFVTCKEKLFFIDDIYFQEISLREAAAANSRSGG